jgi:hypothetical protein
LTFRVNHDRDRLPVDEAAPRVARLLARARRPGRATVGRRVAVEDCFDVVTNGVSGTIDSDDVASCREESSRLSGRCCSDPAAVDDFSLAQLHEILRQALAPVVPVAGIRPYDATWRPAASSGATSW